MGTVGEDEVMGFEDEFGGGWGGDNNGRDGSEPHGHDRAVGSGQAEQVLVRVFPEQVEVADDRKADGPRRQTAADEEE